MQNAANRVSHHGFLKIDSAIPESHRKMASFRRSESGVKSNPLANSSGETFTLWCWNTGVAVMLAILPGKIVRVFSI